LIPHQVVSDLEMPAGMSCWYLVNGFITPPAHMEVGKKRPVNRLFFHQLTNDGFQQGVPYKDSPPSRVAPFWT